MQKIILDTNVVVSALIQKSFPYFILHELYLERNIELCISPALFSEYEAVLKRDKFSRFPDFTLMAGWVLRDISEHAKMFHPYHTLDIIKDKDDNRLLELAETSQANYLVTGNSNDFTMPVFKQTKIVSPKEYWELYR